MYEKNLKATHQGSLIIGEISIPCAVLEDGTRILRERSVAKTLGKKGSGTHWKEKREKKGAVLPEYVSAKILSDVINDELRQKLLNPITYKTLSNKDARGIDAKLLPEICDIWLKAREIGVLNEKQIETAKKSEILMRGFATIGIIALVDEATGYQEIRDKKALQEILAKFISNELLAWAKRFPDEFYKELFRLKGWQYSPISVKRPMLVGKLTNDIIYMRLAPGVLRELTKKNPILKKGRRKDKHHQWLTEDIGHPALKEHIIKVVTLMKAAANWQIFYRLIQRVLPKYGDTLQLPLEYQDEKG